MKLLLVIWIIPAVVQSGAIGGVEDQELKGHCYSKAPFTVSTSFSSPWPLRMRYNTSIVFPVLTSSNNLTDLVLLVQANPGSNVVCSAALVEARSPYSDSLQVIWRQPCRGVAYSICTLAFTEYGTLDLVVNGTVVAWSSNTEGDGVRGLRVTKNGLQLFNSNNGVVWDSKAHPTSKICRDSIWVHPGLAPSAPAPGPLRLAGRIPLTANNSSRSTLHGATLGATWMLLYVGFHVLVSVL